MIFQSVIKWRGVVITFIFLLVFAIITVVVSAIKCPVYNSNNNLDELDFNTDRKINRGWSLDFCGFYNRITHGSK